MRKGFTLIELLIVVLIIAILAAIAVPNFIEFQTRAKVSRIKADHRSLATALEAYYVDNDEYPAMSSGADGANARPEAAGPPPTGAYNMCTFRMRNADLLQTLTTTIAYITSYFPDPFASTRGTTFGYRQFQNQWILFSYGPDKDENKLPGPPDPLDHHMNDCVVQYTVLGGGIVRDNAFETPYELSMGQPTAMYLAGISATPPGMALHYDPSNGTTSEGDIVKLKQ